MERSDKQRVLVVDDDREIVAAIVRLLEREGIEAIPAYNGREAVERLTENEIHLIIIDIMMPEMDGISATIKIRTERNIPVIMLSAKTEESDKILGLSVGADDYVTKPFSPAELIARVKSQLRRYMTLGDYANRSGGSDVALGGLLLHREQRQLDVDGEPVKLTPKEYRIVELLMSNPGRVFSAEEIYERVWNETAYSVENTIMVHIRRIREKIEINPNEPRYLKVVWGIGYKMEKIQPYYTYYIDDSGFLASEDSPIPDSLYGATYDVPDNIKVSFGIPQRRFDFLKTNWDITRHNMLVIIISDGVLMLAGLAALIMLCRTSGEKADGTVTFPKFFKLWFEPSVLLLCWYTYVAIGSADTVARDVIFRSYYTSGILEVGFPGTVESVMALVMYGLGVMAFGAILTYIAVSVCIRAKNKSVEKGFLIYWVFHFIWKALKALGRALLTVCRTVREFCTGELYKTDRAAKKFVLLDVTFIGITLVVLALFLAAASNNVWGLMLFWCVVWFIALGLFLYGRYLVTRDEAKLEQQIREISQGNYSYDPQLSKNSPYTASCEVLSKVADGYRRGIEESVKAERTKIELITNVSHDLKTPLTSIISYIDLLSRENLEPQAREYVGILQKKSERLKHIVSDVFELAKTTSGEITVEHERLDLTRLSNQTLAEMEDKISAAGLMVKTDICEPPVEVISDGKRLYRVIQNLMDNALKYSLRGTRIYYTLKKDGGTAEITIKNIAAYEMDFTKEEILERFSRGDKARSTEGSGLGLSIAQGFTIACGGAFDIDIDGDMFKVRMTFPLAAPAEITEEKTAVTADA